MSDSDQVSDVVEVSSEHLFHLQVPANLKYFEGHFVGEPILAAVVQLDVVVLPRIERIWPELGHVTRATKMKFRVPIRAEDHITLRLLRKGHKKSVDVTILRDAVECASGTLLFA